MLRLLSKGNTLFAVKNSVLPHHTENNQNAKRSALTLVLATSILTAAATTVFLVAICYALSQPDTVKTTLRLGTTLGSSSQVGTVAAAAANAPYAWQVKFNDSHPIPMQLWQTSRSLNVSQKAKGAMATWQQLNPSIPSTLQNDSTAAAFIRALYGEDVHKLFQSFPIGVMRADFWRYAILYAYGGIYADLDTQCLKPVDQWFPPRSTIVNESLFVATGDWKSAGGLEYHQLSWYDCAIVIALENEHHLCQWIIASVAGHPVLREVIRLMITRAQEGFDLGNEHLVHYHTGPGIWSQAVAEVLGVPCCNASHLATAVWTDPMTYRRARSMGICIVAASFWGGEHAQNARNLYGSIMFEGGESYPSWWVEREQMLKEAAIAAATAAASKTMSNIAGKVTG